MNTAKPFAETGMPPRDWWQELWPDLNGLLKQSGIRPGMRVLDLCCGDGFFTPHIAELTGERVYAIELDPILLRETGETAVKNGLTSVTWICGDACQADSLIPGPVDYIWFANTFHGVPDHPRLLRSIHRALKPGGQFTIINWHARPREETTIFDEPRGPPTEYRMAPETVRAIVEESGFCLQRKFDVGPYHYAVVVKSS